MMKWFRGRVVKNLMTTTVEAAKKIPEASRPMVARHLLEVMNTTHKAYETLPVSTFIEHLAEVTAKAKQMRNIALYNGASSQEAPEWNAASLVELWTGARLGALRGLISTRAFDAVDKLGYEFILETLDTAEIAKAIEER